MKKSQQHYQEQITFWRERKALEFFTAFIRNHKKVINDNDVFQLIAGFRTSEEWIKLIKAGFSGRQLEMMRNFDNRRGRLDFDDGPQEMFRCIWNKGAQLQAKLRKLLIQAAEEEMAEHPLAQYAGEPFPQRLNELRKTFDLSDFEIDIMLVTAFVSCDLLTIADGHNRRTDENDKAVFIAKCLDCGLEDVMQALDEHSKLRRYGCVDSDFDFANVIRAFLLGSISEPLVSRFFKSCRERTLPWKFYGMLAERHGEMLKKIINSSASGTPVNILFYGAPGTGKTSFAKTLAVELGRQCYIVAQEDRCEKQNGSAGVKFRFSSLQLCSDHVNPDNSLVIVDEADEMLGGCDMMPRFSFGGRIGDKGLLNNAMDSLCVPVIWIANSNAAELAESSRRRFDYSVCFEPLNGAQRISIWHNVIESFKCHALITEDMVNRFAGLYPISAGGIAMVVKNLVRMSPPADKVEKTVAELMEQHCQLLGVPTTGEKLHPAKDYSLNGLNIRGTLPLKRIVEAVRNFRKAPDGGTDRPRMNILLSGAPGTGKTEFVKYLADAIGARLVVQMGSDLLGMYVGETEHRIRRAFERAEAENAVLFLDEIDGLVQSRERADHSWEVTQVNELLHRMENFKGVMIGATNFAANLDSAVLRRFTFKLEFDYLDEAGKKLFFKKMFKTDLTEEEVEMLNGISNLTPGDFRTVRQGLYYLGDRVTNTERIESLRNESEAKNRNRYAVKAKVGF